jgi:sec-independent protein translocase protein TatC
VSEEVHKDGHDDIEASKAPLLDHLIELRSRLIKAVLAFTVMFAICFVFAKDIYNVLVWPFVFVAGAENSKFIYTALLEYFVTQLKLAMFGAAFLSFPIVAGQIYMFVAPGLYKNERKAFLPFLIATPFLFIAGAAFVYYIMLPFAIRFFLGYEVQSGHGALGIQLQAKVSEYLDFITTLIFAFGLTFQMPVLLSLLGRVGILTSAQLRSARRYAIVGITVLAAVLTPPDAISMFSLMVPLIFLYEVSILCVKLIERGRAKEEAARANS